MKKVMFILVVAVAIACRPADAAALGSQVADVPPAALAPSQRDINIAALAVVVGGMLVGYERISRERKSRVTARYRGHTKRAHRALF